MTIALQAENSTGRSQMVLLDECDRVLRQRFPRKNWGFALPDSFLVHAIKCGLTKYVRSKLDYIDIQDWKTQLGKRSALDLATWEDDCDKRVADGILARHQPAMVNMLLEAGFNPNSRTLRVYQSPWTTPWLSLLEYFETNLIDTEKGLTPGTKRFDFLWLDIVKLYLMFGADVKAYQSRVDRRLSLWDLFRKCFGHLPPEPVLELKRLIEERAAKAAGFSTPREHLNDSPHRHSAGRETQRKEYNTFHLTTTNHPNLEINNSTRIANMKNVVLMVPGMGSTPEA